MVTTGANGAVPGRSDAADKGGGAVGPPSPPGGGGHRQHHRSASGRAMRHRAGRDVSSTSRGGRHVTNINRINVINNYGVAEGGAGNYFSPPPRTRERRARERLGWGALRAALAVLLLLWFAAVASVMKSSAPPRHPQSPSPYAAVGFLEKVNGANGPAAEDEGGAGAEAEAEPKPPPRDAEEKEHHSIFELSMFGNTSPSDFQRYTPDAPSCSRPLETASVSYTLVSQLSNDRIWMVPYHCKRWGPDNPMSIVVFSDRSADDVKSELVSKGCHADSLAVQTVARTKYDPTGTEYPVNLLRNMALSAVRTSHVVYADIDFWPSSDLLSILSGEAIRERFASDPKLAAVVPVFQMYRRCKEYRDCREVNVPLMPRNKAALLSLIVQKKASTFDPTNVGGHGSTKYITWRDQKVGTFVDLRCIKSNRYEPYLVFRYCDSLPPFQEGFTGYGKNKMTWVMQLRRSGYLFSQIGGAFLVHYPHLDSKARLEWNKKPRAMEKYGYSASDLLEDKNIDWGSYKRARIDALFLDFKEWLDGTVEDESRVPMCQDALNDDVRLWVHQGREGSGDEEEEEVKSSSDEDEEGMEAEVGEKESYDEFLKSKKVYNECQEEHSNGNGECFKAACDFIEMSILWSLEGGMSGRLDPSGEMEVLAEAERCAAPLLPSHRDDGGADGKGHSFQKLVATLYVNMGRVERSRHNTSRAIEYASHAAELNPSANDAQQLLSKLRGRGDVSQ